MWACPREKKNSQQHKDNEGLIRIEGTFVSELRSIVGRQPPMIGSSMRIRTSLRRWMAHNWFNHSLNWGLNISRSINNNGGHNSSIGDDSNNSGISRGSSILCSKVLNYGFHVALEEIHFTLELSQGFFDNNILVFDISHDSGFVSSGIVCITSHRHFCRRKIIV